MLHHPPGMPPAYSNSEFNSDTPFSRIMGFSFLATLLGMDPGSTGQGATYLMNSMRLFLLGTIIEAGRRLFGWVMFRFKPFQYSISAHFSSGDPAYEWITLFLTEERIWDRSRKFQVNSRSSMRQWTVDIQSKTQGGYRDEHTEFVPIYDSPQLFHWKGYLVEMQKGGGDDKWAGGQRLAGGMLAVTMYTRDMAAMAGLIEEARQRYLKISRPHVIVRIASHSHHMHGGSIWGTTKRKARRPISSIILQEGVVKSLVDDAREFFKSEAWYSNAGIPHRRGYLLHGPPGTGKTSTIYAVAGELQMEIYSLSLSSDYVDDSFLELAAAAMPKYSILLIEDIDCAFPSREAEEGEQISNNFSIPGPVATAVSMGSGIKKSRVTLSALLNVLDGVGSEEGKIFFATTNYIDRLDPALMRPGRIDKKFQYKLATQEQAAGLFLRFFPQSTDSLSLSSISPEKTGELDTLEMSQRFAASVPQHEFSIAELQGFLLTCKHDPRHAVEEIGAWVQNERSDQEARQKREANRKGTAYGGAWKHNVPVYPQHRPDVWFD